MSQCRHGLAGEEVLRNHINLKHSTFLLALNIVNDKHTGGDGLAKVELESTIVGANGDATLIGRMNANLHKVGVIQVI